MKKFVLVLGMMFSVSLFAQDNDAGTKAGKTGVALVKGAVTFALSTDLAQNLTNNINSIELMAQEMEATKTLLMVNLEAGNDNNAKKYAKILLADLYFTPEMYPLFENVIDETIVQVINCETAKSELTDLFTTVFPKMLNTNVVSSEKASDGSDIKISEIRLRQEALSSIANGMFTNMKKVCTETEQLVINEALDEIKRMVVWADDAVSNSKYTNIVLFTMGNVFEENGLVRNLTFNNK